MEFEDEELVCRAVAGNHVAFNLLVARFRPGVRRMIARFVHSRQLAEDVEQEAFVLAFRTLRNLREPEKFGGWILAIARNRALRAAKAHRSEQTLVRSIHDQEIGDFLHAAQDDFDWISSGIQQLPDEFARPAILHYLEGWSVRKLSEDLQLPETTIKWRLHRARQLLKQKMGPCED